MSIVIHYIFNIPKWLSSKGLKLFSWFLMVSAMLWCNLLIAQFPDDFQRTELVTDLSNPVKFGFAPDGRVFILDRYGELLIYKPNLQTTVSAGVLPVFHEFEDGLIGIEFDPDFEVNKQLYLHYSPVPTSVNRVSRFTMNGDQLDLASEVILLEWNTQRNACCHAGGDLAFDSKGNLYIATGDNTNHSKYATLDEIDINNSSEKSSSNTDDLRGKILRITPQSDGSYSIPQGNLFPGGSGGLPEIYVMGARNPYSIFVDKDNTDWLFWGEVGPDANKAGVEGPEGMDEINLTKAAGNYGWPYFSGKNEPYLNQYANPSFYYDPAAPVNLSTWNTGATSLPPAQPSWLEFFHKSYLTGPRYYFDPSLKGSQRLPIDFDGSFFYFDFNTSRVWVTKLDTEGNILENKPFAPSIFSVAKTGFIDMNIGPDGHLYILEYGAGCCPYNSGEGKLIRVDYQGDATNSSPVVSINADPISGSLPLQVTFSSEGTYDPEGGPLTYEWDFNEDGIIDSNQKHPVFTYTKNGKIHAVLTVSDGEGMQTIKNILIHPGNNAATFNIISPADGGLFNWDDDINFDLTVSDKQDGSTQAGNIDCSDISVSPSFVHDTHFHQQAIIMGCQGWLRLKARELTRINSGGGGVAVEAGVFGADQYATGGSIYENTVPIAGTTDDVLYQTELFGEYQYQVPVIDPGNYTIRLHFAEIYHGVKVAGGIGDRIFDVSIENNPVLSDFDILKEVAPATVLIKELENIVVNDEILTIKFTSVVGDPKVSALEVTPLNTVDIYGNDELYQLIGVSYTDKGGLISSDTVKLFPKRHEAEFYNTQQGISLIANSDNWGGGNSAVRVYHNSHISFTGRNLANIQSVRYRFASDGGGGTIELRMDSPTGPIVSSTEITATGGSNNWSDKGSLITDPGGKHDLYFVFNNESTEDYLFDLNYIEFEGKGISVENSPPAVIEVKASSTTSIQVEFSEFVSVESAEDLANYIIEDGNTLVTASLSADKRTVILTTSKLRSGVNYNLEISNVQNTSGLTMKPGTFPFTLVKSPSYSDILPALKVYPNPTDKQLTLEVELITSESIHVNIYDSMGREFYSKPEHLNEGKNLVNLELENLKEGLYFLKLTSKATNLPGFKIFITN